MLFIKPLQQSKPKNNPDRQFVNIRDCQDSNWRNFGNWITQVSCDDVINASETEDKCSCFMNKLNCAMVRTFIPITKIRIHPDDKPWITPAIKKYIKKQTEIFFPLW